MFNRTDILSQQRTRCLLLENIKSQSRADSEMDQSGKGRLSEIISFKIIFGYGSLDIPEPPFLLLIIRNHDQISAVVAAAILVE